MKPHLSPWLRDLLTGLHLIIGNYGSICIWTDMILWPFLTHAVERHQIEVARNCSQQEKNERH